MRIKHRNYGVMNIANYIVSYAVADKKPVSNLMLQEVVYYAYVVFLTKHHVKLFEEPIEKRPYGPISPDVYDNFKSHGVAAIKAPAPLIITDGSTEPNDINLFGMVIREFDMVTVQNEFEKNGDDLAQLNQLIERLLDMHLHGLLDLIEKTQKQPMWQNYKDEIEAGQQGLHYSDEEIMDYFQKASIPF